jgi:hypothetical protein
VVHKLFSSSGSRDATDGWPVVEGTRLCVIAALRGEGGFEV